MKKAELIFIVSITAMSCAMIYAMYTKNIYLLIAGQVGFVLDIIAFWRYNR